MSPTVYLVTRGRRGATLACEFPNGEGPNEVHFSGRSGSLSLSAGIMWRRRRPGARTRSQAASAFPEANALINADTDNNDWILPGKDYANNPYTGLAQITAKNVRSLAKAWSTQIADNGQQETSPIVWHGTMFLSTPHESVLALDAATGRLKWQFPYNPPQRPIRGFTWRRTSTRMRSSLGSPPAKPEVSVTCRPFSTTDGHRLWDWHSIPFPGEPGHKHVAW